uniref:Bm9542, isoform a n=1 Tax=Brugia malayi TaxID=6279 RepID=A0A1I9G1B7_BRUMA|nr:Bm9542, isoform a [Brugia malayi]
MVNSKVVPTNVSGDDGQFMKISTNLIWLSAFLTDYTDAMPCATGVYHVDLEDAGQSILTIAFRTPNKRDVFSCFLISMLLKYLG